MRGMRGMFCKLVGGVCGVAGSIIAGMDGAFIVRRSTYQKPSAQIFALWMKRDLKILQLPGIAM